jgi:hypothetical protein
MTKRVMPDHSAARFGSIRKMVLKAKSAEAELHEKVQTLMRETKRSYSEAIRLC